MSEEFSEPVVPLRPITSGKGLESVMMLMVPDSGPGVEGLKATSKVASVPAVSVKGRVKPDILKADPLATALVIFTEFCPLFVNWID